MFHPPSWLWLQTVRFFPGVSKQTRHQLSEDATGIIIRLLRYGDLCYLFGMVSEFTWPELRWPPRGFLKKVRNWITVCCGNSNSNQQKNDMIGKRTSKTRFFNSSFLFFASARKNKISQCPGIEAYLVFISSLEKNETCRIIYIIRAKYLTKKKWVPPETWEYHQPGVKETNPEGWQRFATNLTNSRQMPCSCPCSFSSGGGLLYITCLGNDGSSSRCWKGCFISGGKMEPM